MLKNFSSQFCTSKIRVIPGTVTNLEIHIILKVFIDDLKHYRTAEFQQLLSSVGALKSAIKGITGWLYSFDMNMKEFKQMGILFHEKRMNYFEKTNKKPFQDFKALQKKSKNTQVEPICLQRLYYKQI